MFEKLFICFQFWGAFLVLREKFLKWSIEGKVSELKLAENASEGY